MRETLGALGVGVAIAAIVSCGGAKKSAMAPSTAGGEPGALPVGKHDQRIVELDAKLTKDFAELGVGERPTPPPTPTVMSTCENPPCDAAQTSIKLRKDDPTCKPGAAQVCTDTCKLSDSICDSAVKICTIAKELGSDTWANEKCTSGTSSCETAQGKCCGCS